MIGNLLQDVCKRITDYLDGDLQAAAKFPEQLKDLDDELELEEDSGELFVWRIFLLYQIGYHLIYDRALLFS